MKPEIAVIIPTRNRAERLSSTLGTLAWQTVPPDVFEVIVVADGCRDGTAARVRSTDLPFAVRVLEQPASGAASARNRGAELTGAPLLLFLDDDMEASPGLLDAHLETHRRNAGCVALGYFRYPRREENDVLANHVDVWWGDRFSSLCEGSHRFTFMDLVTGNVSLSADLFAEVGRFDERFVGRAGEDYELGVRLVKHGARFRFVREAACIHHDRPTRRRMVGRAYAEGRGHVLVAGLHPETFPALPIREAADGGPWLRVMPGVRCRPWTLARLSLVLSVPLEAMRRLKVRRVHRVLLGFARYCSYWKGVLDEMGSRQEIHRFAQDMPLRAPGVPAVDLDLETDLSRLSTILDGVRATAAALWHGDRVVGYVPSVPVSEPLRVEHVVHALVNACRKEFLAARRVRNRSARAPARFRHETEDRR
jgi:GT2 family glycosyltransferase